MSPQGAVDELKQCIDLQNEENEVLRLARKISSLLLDFQKLLE